MTDVFYSISPFGTADIQTGSGNIEVDASGNATFSVAQTGNIGIGCCVEYNSIVSYISEMTDSTHAKLITAVGATAASQTSTSLTSIHHVWASLSAAEAAYMGASFLNTTDLVTGTFNPYLCCYYDHDDQTPDITVVTWSGATADATYYLTIKTPKGGTESINIQRSQDSKFDTDKFYVEASGSVGIETLVDKAIRFEGLQWHNTDDVSSGAKCIIITTADLTDFVIDSCIMQCGANAGGLAVAATGTTGTVKNSIIYTAGSQGGSSEGILFNGETLVIDYCTLYNFNDGIERDAGTVTVTNCIVFGNGDDFDGTMTIDHCASDDGDGTNAVTLGTYASIFTDYTNGDFSILNFTGTGAVIEQGTPISGITTDIIGTTRDSSTPDIGAFEYVAGGGGITYTLNVLDDVGLTDIVRKQIDFNRSIQDGVGATDTVRKLGSFNRSIRDNVGITDSTRKQAVFTRSIKDNVGVTDKIINYRSIVRSVFDAIGISDKVIKALTFTRSIKDDVGITDETIKQVSYTRTTKDDVGATDSVVKSTSFNRSVKDDIGVTDTTVNYRSIVRAVFDNIGITDKIKRTASFTRSIKDNVGVTDKVTKAASFVRNILDSIGITDKVTSSGGVIAGIITEILHKFSVIKLFFSGKSAVHDEPVNGYSGITRERNFSSFIDLEDE